MLQSSFFLTTLLLLGSITSLPIAAQDQQQKEYVSTA